MNVSCVYERCVSLAMTVVRSPWKFCGVSISKVRCTRELFRVLCSRPTLIAEDVLYPAQHAPTLTTPFGATAIAIMLSRLFGRSRKPLVPFDFKKNKFKAKKKWPPDIKMLPPGEQFKFERSYRRRAKLKWARPRWNKWLTVVQWTSISCRDTRRLALAMLVRRFG